MTTSARLLSGLVAPLLVLSLAGCSDDPDTKEPVLSERQARDGLLKTSDLGPGFRRLTAGDDSDDDDNLAIDCLGGAAFEFDSQQGVTEVQVEYRKKTDARGGTETSVQSAVSSYAEADRAEASLDALRDAMVDCKTAEYEQDGASVRFTISVSEGRTAHELDQQLNLELAGVLTIGETALPLVVHLRYFRIGNHGGTLSVTQFNTPERAAEVDRLLELSVQRFVAVVNEAA